MSRCDGDGLLFLCVYGDWVRLNLVYLDRGKTWVCFVYEKKNTPCPG